MNRHSFQLWRRALAVWFLLMSAEFVHGVWRMKFLALWVGDFLARQVCVFTGSLLICSSPTCASVGFLLGRHAHSLPWDLFGSH